MAFRAFGGGATLCPGRHFASTEILAFVSVMLLRFDIKPVSGVWDTTGYKEANAAFRLPKQDINVELIPRDNEKWHVFFSEPGKPMEITEDIAAGMRDTEGNYSSKSHNETNINLRTISLGWIGTFNVEDEMKMATLNKEAFVHLKGKGSILTRPSSINLDVIVIDYGTLL